MATEFHIGDFVNTMRPGSLNSQPGDKETDGRTDASARKTSALSSLSSMSDASSASDSIMAVSSSSSILTPSDTISATGGTPQVTSSPYNSILFGTVLGMIGTILTLTEESFQFFFTLERAMKTVAVTGVGSFSHDEWRNFYNERRNRYSPITVLRNKIVILNPLRKYTIQRQ